MPGAGSSTDGWSNPFALEQIANFRPVAPSAALGSGGTLRANMLYRTAQLNYATPTDVAAMKALGLKTYIDLREPVTEPAFGLPFDEYFAMDGSTVPPGQPRRLSIPVSLDIVPGGAAGGSNKVLPDVPDSDPRKEFWAEWEIDGKFVTSHDPQRIASPELTTKFLLGFNKMILTFNSERVLVAMKTLADSANYPVVFGCMTGKDRTGLLAALVLGALGASRETIIADYLESNAALDHNMQVLELMKDGSPVNGSDQAHKRNALAVTEGVMAGTLDFIDEAGGAVKLLDSIGFGASDLAKLKALLWQPSEASPNL
jgi:protein-tyrosine phosphatase